MMKNRRVVGLLLVAVLGVLACDRGFDLYPIGWSVEGDVWVYQNEEMRIELLPPGGLVGDAFLDPEPEIMNLAQEDLTVSGPVFRSQSQEHEGHFGIIDGKPRLNRTVPSGETISVPFSFDLPGPLRDVVGEKAVLRFDYRVGNGPLKVLEVELERR